MKGFRFLCSVLFVCFFQASEGYTQVKTSILPEITISNNKKAQDNNQSITKEELDLSSDEDVGIAVKRFAGITLKNYGGVGGLKTISYRGIPGTHTSILVDGFSIQNTQIGQIDLGAISSDNVKEIRFITAYDRQLLAPVSALINGNFLAIETLESSFSTVRKMRLSFNNGSFGYNELYAGLNGSYSNWFFGIGGRFRSYKGDFPYDVLNGNQSYLGNRSNNDLKDASASICFGVITSSRSRFKFNLQESGYSKGLPGAVVLYNNTANQRLSTLNHQLNADWVFCAKDISARSYFSWGIGGMTYSDPSYLNDKNGIKSDYENQSLQLGQSINYHVNDSVFSVFGGFELTHSTLKQVSFKNINPIREHGQGVVGFEWIKKNFVNKSFFGFHRVLDLTNASLHNTAYVGGSEFNVLKANKWIGKSRLSLKKTYRMPSFGELYYNNVSTSNLRPERVSQLNIGTTFSELLPGFELRLDVYANWVMDKIVAIPTKNLFVWSILNVGKVFVSGSDLLMQKRWVIDSVFQWNVKGVYSLQYALDKSDENSVTFNHQIAYLPVHSGNMDVSFEMIKYKMGSAFSIYAVSNRFSLNENNKANWVNGFGIMDLMLFKTISFNENQSLRISISVKNLANSAYEYIRYFVMPGRNYMLRLSYGF